MAPFASVSMDHNVDGRGSPKTWCAYRNVSQNRQTLLQASTVSEASSSGRFRAAQVETAADAEYSFACPICLTTELKVQKASSR